ncbi:helical backbone metal receptor [Desulfofustis glycolicus]|uniref:ABC-type Fe3+-hydroxamate transport system, substrate-binding protein n=1 Tax=Desulfofustis glycolicus DSM 9705 TaxID=1121409 RepID=A0A1M5X1S6_9BACT|nr:helical backbone metal receptor [Desulfofustis glycolicus]SHH93552.1 ABC-type Fe3+-hydroxamate transport system, substrate-binding protein [Desulfofustis glycolicus DSM 9705]
MFIRTLTLFIFVFLPQAVAAGEFPLVFSDSGGAEIVIEKPPQRVVSLVPSITEILFSIGADSAVAGITHHSLLPHGMAEKPVVGGFLSPDLARAAALEPDVVFYTELQQGVVEAFGREVILIDLSANSVEQGFAHIRLLGRMFEREAESAAVLEEQQQLLTLVEMKTAALSAAERPRVIRLMGSDPVMVPGDDSFQNEYIRRAGGTAPLFGKNGSIVSLDLSEWQDFNPQVIYACGDGASIFPLLQLPGWKDVDAIQDNRVMFFPCDLTCRVAAHPGSFVAWLAARLHEERFSDPQQQLLADGIVVRRPLLLPLTYISSAWVVESNIKDFNNKSVLVEFAEPMRILSTLEGWRENIRWVGNHYFPPPAWGLGHQEGVQGLRRTTLAALGREAVDTALLFTGADMGNLALVSRSYRDLQVTALVTAGVQGNAMRAAFDEGLYYELDDQGQEKSSGTINILLLTNATLSPRAMSRALIGATEAKSAALQDLDIRSSYSALFYPATGTGTDNILVVQGSGPPVDAAGGHTRLGELIGKVVYDGVRDAVLRQNGLSAGRTVFQRLRERKIDLSEICRSGDDHLCEAGMLEKLLLEPRYESFVHAALAISDDHERGLIKDLSSFNDWCRVIAAEIAGQPVELKTIDNESLPATLRLAFGALTSGFNGCGGTEACYENGKD